MKKIFLFASCLLLLATGVVAAGLWFFAPPEPDTRPGTPAEWQRCHEAVATLIARVAAWEASHGVARVRSAGTIKRSRQGQDFRRGRTLDTSFDSDLDVKCDPATGAVFRFCRSAPMEPGTEMKPVWTKEQAIEKATSALLAIRGSTDDLGPPQCDFHTTSSTSTISGTWTILWQRSSRDHHLFQDDLVSLYLNEKWGIEAYVEGFWSQYTELPPGNSPKPWGEVAAKADRLVALEIDPTTLLGMTSRASVMDGHSHWLAIIHPNHYLPWPDMLDRLLLSRHPLEGRLAWVGAYGWRDEKRRFRGETYVYIDALTGNYLGGDNSGSFYGRSSRK